MSLMKFSEITQSWRIEGIFTNRDWIIEEMNNIFQDYFNRFRSFHIINTQTEQKVYNLKFPTRKMSFAVKIILIVLTIYTLSTLLAGQLTIPKKQLQEKLLHLKRSPQFHNPSLALKVLQKLDVFSPVEEHYFKNGNKSRSNYHQPLLGLKNDEEYCEKQRDAFVKNPGIVFDEMNVLFDIGRSHLVRNKALPQIGNDIQPTIGEHMSARDWKEFIYDIRPDVNIFWTSRAMNEHKHLGKHFSCLSQMSNHLLGRRELGRKDYIAENAIAYAKNFKSRPQCFSHDKFFPETWLLYEKEDCQNFFKILNSVEYEETKKEKHIVFIRKIASASHRGEGVQPVDKAEEEDLKMIYENGRKCGAVDKNYIVQTYVHNPLLLNDHKFDFRVYMLVASTDPMIAFYHDGFLRVTLANYDASSSDKKVLLTNLALNKQIYDDVKGGHLYEGMDEESLKQAQQWSYQRLQDYLLEKKIITDPNWLDNYLRPQFKKAMIHLLRMTTHAFRKDRTTFELFGVDFLLDTNLNLWFIEANSGPAIGGYSVPMEKFIVKMVQDHFEIAYGILKSRMKRVLSYVNKIIDHNEAKLDVNGEIEIRDLQAKEREFREISKNYFEREFEPSLTNGFKKIIDANYEGMKMYQGLVEPECL